MLVFSSLLSGCSDSNSDEKIISTTLAEEFDKLGFKYNDRIYRLKTDEFNLTRKDLTGGFSIIPGYYDPAYLTELPQGWKEVGKLKNGKELETAKANKEIAEKREAAMSEKKEYIYYTPLDEILTEDLDCSLDSMVDKTIYAQEGNDHYLYLQIDDKYYLFKDDVAISNWIIYQHQIYICLNDWNTYKESNDPTWWPELPDEAEDILSNKAHYYLTGTEIGSFQSFEKSAPEFNELPLDEYVTNSERLIELYTTGENQYSVYLNEAKTVIYVTRIINGDDYGYDDLNDYYALLSEEYY